jgi:hypothetical protein
VEKFKKAFKGDLKSLKIFFDKTYKGEDFVTAFNNRKRLRIKDKILSYDFIYILYRSPDGEYVLFEREFD